MGMSLGITMTCEHRRAVNILWITCGQGVEPPVLFIERNEEGPIVITLTNQTFYVKCPGCFNAVRKAATRLTRDNVHPHQPPEC